LGSGCTAGVDMSLYLVEKLHSRALAEKNGQTDGV